MVSKLKLKIKQIRIHRINSLIFLLFPKRKWFGEKGKVYLTFDDGPHYKTTPWILDELKKNGIKATFFWLGKNYNLYPELVQRTINEGHSIGHHGFEHLSGANITFEQFKANFNKSKQIINTNLFRPPYGRLKQKQAKYAKMNGNIIMWSWMSYDFDANISCEKIIEIAEKNIKSKDILVFHENEKTVERINKIIPSIIEIVQKKELDFATVN